jgi:Tfp pilus assembly protein PilV
MNEINYKKGITLVETIVAVTILAAAIAGPMTLASQGLNASRDARNELIAAHLAEEGIEIIHNIRDNNSGADLSTNRTAWLTNILSICGGNGCGIDVTDHASGVWGPNATFACTSATCSSEKPAYFNPVTGIYKQSPAALGAPWQLTAFTRVVQITPIDDPVAPVRQVHITVTVSYVGYRNNLHTVVVGDDLYNWFPPLQ